MTEGFVSDFFPAAAGFTCVLANQHLFGGGQETKDNGWLFIAEAGLDDEAAELDFAPGIKPAFGVNYPLHLSSVPQ